MPQNHNADEARCKANADATAEALRQLEVIGQALCSRCQLPIHRDDAMSFYGTHVTHRNPGRCIELLNIKHAAGLAACNSRSWEKLHAPRPLEEWHEDHFCALWHLMPIDQPPYVGSPDCSDWPFDEEDEARLYWTPLPDCNLINENWEALTEAANV